MTVDELLGHLEEFGGHVEVNGLDPDGNVLKITAVKYNRTVPAVLLEVSAPFEN